MGSDHYCLRWNNHQSNLLGVFSQLLRDESLVDVTLACSEGHSIRAHKVVLSACSSYFQTLFVDHPARHPIVILKDVRFAELSTLIEFMYHGEVNVEHCQLSELLRTAESLKVKGLTDMGTTNLPATGLQPSPGNKVQLQTPSQLSATTCNYNTSSSTSGSSTSCCKTETPDNNNPAAATMAEPEQTEPTELVIKPNKPSTSLSIVHSDREELNPMVTAVATCMTTSSSTGDKTNDISALAPMSLVAPEKRSTTATVDHQPPISQQHQFHMPPISQPDQNSNNSTHKDSPTRLTLSPHAGSSIESENLRPDSDMDEELDDSCDESEDYKPSDMRLLTTVTTEANRLQRHDGNSVNLVPAGAGLGPSGNSVGMSGILARLPSPIIGTGAAEPIAGPSNILPPVQQVPLSLKKEVDWGGTSADEKSNVGSPSDYPRHSLDPSITDIERCFITTSPATSSRQSSSRSSTPAFTALPQAQQLPATVDSIAAAVVGYHQQHHHNLTSSLLEAGLVHPALFNAAAAAAAVAAAGASVAAAAAAVGEGDHLYRCNACMAAFPSIWLLEQHTALQHIGNLGAASTSSSAIDKPFVCEQCGQSYRYRSAYVKHREQNHRARLPADKLFSCDFCGMQFRYLKSFKKHRLNHALERLHGKANSETRLDMICSREISSGGKDTSTPQIDSIPIENSSDQVSSSNETLTITDDQPTIPSTSACKPDTLGSPQLITDTEDNDIENPSTSGQREHIIIDSDPMQLAGNTSDSEPEVEQEQDDTIDSAAAAISSLPTVSVAGMLPSTSSGACSAILPSLGTPSELAGGSMATAEAVEAFRSAQQASIINFLRADAAERQRERRFACPFCGKCVRSKENLKLHVRKHTGERPFVCLFCGRAFGGKSDLTRHLRIHTGERPYHCDMCGKCFARADYLSKHLTTHINTPR